MARIAALVEHEENRRLLATWISEQTPHECVDSPVEGNFDLCIVDLAGYDGNRERLQRWKEEAEPILLPYLLVASQSELEHFAPDFWSDVESVFAGTIDDVITTPIQMFELKGRIRVLLRIREQAIDIQEVQARYRALVERSSDVVMVVDEDAVVQYVSPAIERHLGFSPGEIVGGSMLEFIHPDDEREVMAAFQRLVDGGRDTPPVEHRSRHRTGSWRWFESTGSDPGDAPIDGYVINTRDVTDRKERERYLRVIDRVIRHNLRNDMTAIRGYAEMIADAAPEDVAADAEMVIDKSDQLLAVVDKEREITKLLQRRTGAATIDVADLVRRIVEVARERYPDADVHLDRPDTAPAFVLTSVERALQELVENAIVHNDRETPEVEVTVEQTDGTVTVRIADDGPGIPPMERNVLTSEHEIGPLYHGSGLGLWLVHWVVYLSGGTLEFEENDPRGSIVTLLLPKSDGVES